MIPVQISLSKRETKEGAWFYEMDKAGQEAYVKKYPGSKYAKEYKQKQKEKSRAEKGDTVAKVKVSHHVKKHWGKFSEEQKEFFGRGDHKPGSKQRRKLGQIIKSKAKGVVKAIKHEVDEWKDAGKGIKKLATGKKMTSHEKHALKNVAIHAAMVIGPMAISGGLSAGLGTAAKGIGLGLLEHSALIRGAQVAAFASGTGAGRTEIINMLDEVAFEAIAKTEITADMDEEQAIEALIKQMGDAMATAKIPDRVWAEAAIANKK